jgi:hypothetical protein
MRTVYVKLASETSCVVTGTHILFFMRRLHVRPTVVVLQALTHVCAYNRPAAGEGGGGSSMLEGTPGGGSSLQGLPAGLGIGGDGLASPARPVGHPAGKQPLANP